MDTHQMGRTTVLTGDHVLLPDLVLTTRANQQYLHTGLDSPEHCLDVKHFALYPHDVQYDFNSRGFRDEEWPQNLEDLQRAIWCIGDSFTVGVGQPYDHIWPQILSARTGRRTINVAMDGASNAWISRRARQIQQEIRPANMVIMWSYWHRRESTDATLSDEKRRLLKGDSLEPAEDISEFGRCRQSIDRSMGRIDECLIPDYFGHSATRMTLEACWKDIRGDSWPIEAPLDRRSFDLLPKSVIDEIDQLHNCTPYFEDFYRLEETIRDVICVPRLDLARDGHHFDLATAKWLVDQLLIRWQD